MNAYRMAPAQLARGMREATLLAEQISASQPDAARVILDGVEVALLETLVHALKGDREAAEKVHRRLQATDKA